MGRAGRSLRHRTPGSAGFVGYPTSPMEQLERLLPLGVCVFGDGAGKVLPVQHVCMRVCVLGVGGEKGCEHGFLPRRDP